MIIIWIMTGLVSGLAGSMVIQKLVLKGKSQKIIKDAEAKAENIRKERALQSKERFLKQKHEHESKMKERTRKIQSSEDRAKAKEIKLDKRLAEIGKKERDLEKTSQSKRR